MIITDDVLTALRERARTDGHRLMLDGPRLAPRLYERIDEVLRGAGGVWDRAVQAHVFGGDAATALERLLTTRQVTTVREQVQAQQYFPTPPGVVEQLLAVADIRPGMRVLEPSAGRGAIALAAAAAGAQVDAVEIVPEHAEALRAAEKVTVVEADFLTARPDPVYDRVVMNPPFTRGADVQHVQHALTALRPDGRLVAVMSHSTAHNPAAVGFRRLVAERGGSVHPVPGGAFRESGTDVAALIVTIPATRPSPGGPPPVWPAADSAPASPTRASDLPAPAVLARQIAADLRRAQRQFDAVATALERRAQAAGRTQDTDGQLDLFTP